MRFITMLSLMVWATTIMANEPPPELPFQAVDGGGVMQTSDMQNQLLTEQPVSSEPEKVKNPAKKPKKKQKPNKSSESLDALAQGQEIDLGLQSGITIKPKPGKTESIVIAQGKLNRIVTPYADPKVLTVDNMETKIDGSVVYIATSSETPVSLFISDTETGGAASLQLVPRELVTPVEIRIEMDISKVSPSDAASSGASGLFHQDSPYITDVKSIMQSLGKQQIPQGFALEAITDELRMASICHSPILTFTPGQLLSGQDSRIVIMLAQNNGMVPVLFEEAYCAGENVMAVAAWPKVRLEAGGKTEVYILMRLPEGKSGEELRPALL